MQNLSVMGSMCPPFSEFIAISQQLRCISMGICVRRGEVGLTFVRTGKPYVSSLLNVSPSDFPFSGSVTVMITDFSGSNACFVSFKYDVSILIFRGSRFPLSSRTAGGRSCRSTEWGVNCSVDRTRWQNSSMYA